MPIKMFGDNNDFNNFLLPTRISSVKKTKITDQNLIQNSHNFKNIRKVQPIVYSIKGEDTIKYLLDNTN